MMSDEVIVEPTYPTTYKLECNKCKRKYTVEYRENDGHILRWCPVCGERALY